MKKSERFEVPPLTIDPVYKDLVDRRSLLLEKQADLAREHRELAQSINDAPAPAFRPGVAELLGEGADSTSSWRARLREVIASETDVDTALEIVRQRLLAARGKASASVCSIVRPEYARRVADLASALKAAAAARSAYDDLVTELNIEDISWTSLTPLQPNFLGDPRDGHVHRWLREATEAGYHVN
ncbi:hypothetical protein [Rhizobium sp. Root1220]|uniref:hypothetical protein n=1 Tax=Rhizobium sp. Root1220 TaxID=1736432 RepID=UPI0006F3189C|nr:hypothetical protein [Rhizobium sp. Root1220]KQV83658.1 hypothetical protein ASC90_20455 [Rhizobium sp. Root1220]